MDIDSVSDYVSIVSPEKIFFNIEGKIQSLEQYISPRLKIKEKMRGFKIDLLEIIGEEGGVYGEVMKGDIYFDTDFLDENIVGNFSSLLITSSYPRLINPKIITEMFLIFSTYPAEKIEAIEKEYKKNSVYDGIYPSPNNDPADFINYIRNARYREEVREHVEGSFMHFDAINLKKSFYDYLEKFKIQNGV